MNKPGIMYETGLDESFLVGTREQIKALGEQLVRMSETAAAGSDYLGIKVIDLPGPLSEIGCDVVLDAVILTESEGDARELINRIFANNGEAGIDWGGPKTNK